MRKYKIKIIITIHSGMLTMTFRRYILEWIASFLLLNLNNVIYVSDFTRRYWEQRYPWLRLAHSRVVLNGVLIPSSKEKNNRTHKLKIGFVGRVNQEKDPRMFCEIARLGNHRMNEMEFHLFGDGPLLSTLQEEFGSTVIWHGYLNNQDAIYNQIDLLLITSPVENCPYAVLQAKSYGIPTVAPAVGGLPEIIQSGVDGILSNHRTSKDLFEAIEEAIMIYDNLIEGCLDTRWKYCIEKAARNTWMDILLHTK